MNMMNFTKTVMKNLFSKPATRNYPAQPKAFFERTRGHVEIRIQDCIFCGLCSRKCPTGAITVERGEKSWSIERFGCIQCGYCVESCPKKCLSMLPPYPTPAAQKPTETYVQPQPEPETVDHTEETKAKVGETTEH